MKNVHVARSYAIALFRLGRKENCNEQFESELEQVVEVFKGTQLGTVLHSPLATKDEKQALVKEAFAGTHPHILSLVRLLVERGRSDHIAQIFVEFVKARDQFSHSLRVVVRSRFEMGARGLKKIEQRLSELSALHVHLRFEPDPTIVGGIRLFIQDKLIDGTVRAQLDLLRQQLLAAVTAASR